MFSNKFVSATSNYCTFSNNVNAPYMRKTFEVKEIRITPNIDNHDYQFKCKNARKFLEDGNKVKITVRFRGREVNNSAMGEKVLNKFIEDLADISIVEKKPFLEGRNMFIILAPK